VCEFKMRILGFVLTYRRFRELLNPRSSQDGIELWDNVRPVLVLVRAILQKLASFGNLKSCAESNHHCLHGERYEFDHGSGRCHGTGGELAGTHANHNMALA